MPRRKTVKTLKDICLRRIALSFDSYWIRDFDVNLKELPRLLYVIGPFENLTNETIQGIISSLADEKCLRRRHFMCLLQASIKALDLSRAGAANGDLVIQTIIARCTKLAELNLEGLKSISASALAELVAKVPSIRTLNLKSTNCNDQVLSVLAHNNQNITDLDISCTRVSDSGAFSLCQAWDKEGHVGCRNLYRLNIYGTIIRFPGALHLLQNCPKLIYLGFDDVCALLEADVKQQEEKVVREHTVALRYLTAVGLKVQKVSEESIGMACGLCPNTTEARFYCGVNNDNALAITNLQHLRKLQLGKSEGGSHLTFDGGVLPVLLVIGNQLTDLTLADLNDFDLFSIGQTCRNLKYLFIVIYDQNDQVPVTRAIVTTEEKRAMFNKLEELYIIYPLPEIQLHTSAFVTMLSNAKALRVLHIAYLQALTTEIFQEILSNNEMSALETLKLEACNTIGAEFLEILMKGDNCLKTVELIDCKNISMQDYQKYKRLAEKQHFDIDITWK